MQAFVTKSSLLFPNGDNPAGRWSVSCLKFITCMRQQSEMAGSLRALQATLSVNSGKTLLSAVREATSQAEVHAAVCTALGLKSPSTEIHAGLKLFSRYLLRLRRAQASAQVRASCAALAAVNHALSS